MHIAHKRKLRPLSRAELNGTVQFLHSVLVTFPLLVFKMFPLPYSIFILSQMSFCQILATSLKATNDECLLRTRVVIIQDFFMECVDFYLVAERPSYWAWWMVKMISRSPEPYASSNLRPLHLGI